MRELFVLCSIACVFFAYGTVIGTLAWLDSRRRDESIEEPDMYRCFIGGLFISFALAWQCYQSM